MVGRLHLILENEFGDDRAVLALSVVLEVLTLAKHGAILVPDVLIGPVAHIDRMSNIRYEFSFENEPPREVGKDF